MEYTLDIDTNRWPLALQFAFRKHVGVTPQFARLKIARALESADPTSNTAPDEFYNIPPEWLIGLLWAGQQLAGKRVGFDAFVAAIEKQAGETAIYDAIVAAFLAALGMGEEEPDEDGQTPLPETTATSQTTSSNDSAVSRPTKTSSPSASSTAGRKAKSSV